jgi:hypothetical protein
MPSSDWRRRYPPLAMLVAAFAIALAVLPSSLRTPQPSARQTLAYAPVPPGDDDPLPTIAGATPRSVGGVAAAPTLSPTTRAPGGAVTGSPSTKRCVGDPPRQTEDPIAPPCVAYFDGDNFGATHPGVSATEIALVYYVDGHIRDSGCSGGACPRPAGELFDLFVPPDPDDAESSGSKHPIVAGLRAWQRYFNDRFQTYGRTVHFYAAFGPATATISAEQRRADAAQVFARVHPFAVISDATDNQDEFLQAMAQQGVLNSGALFGRPASFYDAFPRLIWSYTPSLEQQATQYSSYVCQKVLPHPSALNGNSDLSIGDDAGAPRRYGIIHTADPAYPNLRRLASVVEAEVRACGVEITATASFPYCCYVKDSSTTHEYANVQMADFQQQGVTTVLWLGGINGYYGPAADAIGYEPEWIVLGDGQLDGNNPVRLMTASRTWDGHAIVVTPQTFEPPPTRQRCYQALREADETIPEADVAFACPYYKNLFQFFVGVQVAGPKLTPASIDLGFHAIPPTRSTDPQIPACFYDPADYTCVKDAQAEVWSAASVAPGDSIPGCWRSIEGGRRSLAHEWPEGNIDAQRTGEEPCNAYSSRVLLR